jgi:hypothetical protein
MNLLKRFLADEYPAEIYGESGLFSLSRGAVAADLVSVHPIRPGLQV